MKTFKELREASPKPVQVTDPEEKKLKDAPADESELDGADENNRNPDGSADSMEVTAFKPVYKKKADGSYTLAKEEVEDLDELSLRPKLAAARRAQADADAEKNSFYGDAERSQARADKMAKHITKRHGRSGKKNLKRAVAKDRARRDREDSGPYDDDELAARAEYFPKGSVGKIMKGGPRKGKLSKDAQTRRKNIIRSDRSLRTRNREDAKVRRNEPAFRKQSAKLARKGRNEEYEDLTENVIDNLKKLVALSQDGKVKLATGSIKVSLDQASAILAAYGGLNKVNQTKMAASLASSPQGFQKMLKFSSTQGKLSRIIQGAI